DTQARQTPRSHVPVPRRQWRGVLGITRVTRTRTCTRILLGSFCKPNLISFQPQDQCRPISSGRAARLQWPRSPHGLTTYLVYPSRMYLYFDIANYLGVGILALPPIPPIN